MSNFLAELRRRNVFRVAAAYLVVGWLVMQVSATIGSAAGLPDWADSLALILLITAFPIIVFITWAFELTPDGMRRTGPADAGTTPDPLNRTDLLLIGALAVAGAIAVAQITTRPAAPAAPDSAGRSFAEAENPGPATAAPPSVDAASIAVLPFADLSPAGDQEYFSDGTSEEILNVLVRVEGLRVASRTSAFAYKNSPLRIPDIASELGVRHILEGSVRRSGDTIRITAQLIDAHSDEHLWSQTYDRTLTTENVFAIQDEISRAIVEALSSRIAGLAPAAPPVLRPDTADIATLDLFYEAHALFIARGVDNLLRATTLLELVTERDPEFARGWASLAMVYAVSEGWGLPSRDFRQLARQAATRAIELNPALATPHAVLGLFAVHQRPGAERAESDPLAALGHYDTAIRLDPNDASIYNWRAALWPLVGFADRALADQATCLRLDPAYINCRYNQYTSLMALGRYDEAQEVNRRLLLDGATVQMLQAYTLQHLADSGQDETLLLAINLMIATHAPEMTWLVEDIFRALRDPAYDRAAGLERFERSLASRGAPLMPAVRESIYRLFQDYERAAELDGATPQDYARQPGMTRARARAYVEAGHLPEFWHAYEFPPGCRAVGASGYDCDWIPDQ